MIDKFLNKIINIDCIDGFKELPDNSIDLIFTDPPYGLSKDGIRNDNNLDCYYSVLPECNRVLKDGGFFITFFSTKFLPEVFKNNPFSYYWNFILHCPNGRVSSTIGFTKYMSCLKKEKGVRNL